MSNTSMHYYTAALIGMWSVLSRRPASNHVAGVPAARVWLVDWTSGRAALRLYSCRRVIGWLERRQHVRHHWVNYGAWHRPTYTVRRVAMHRPTRDRGIKVPTRLRLKFELIRLTGVVTFVGLYREQWVRIRSAESRLSWGLFIVGLIWATRRRWFESQLLTLKF